MGMLKEKQHKKIEQDRDQGEELIDIGKTLTCPLMLPDIADSFDRVEEINEDVKRKFKQMVAELEDFF